MTIPRCNASFSNRIPTNDNAMNFHYFIFEISASTLKLKKNGQISDISKKLLLPCIDYASIHVCKLFNLCIDQGVFPTEFKKANITPVFKKNARNCIHNYRPVSVLCNLSKIFENIIYD